MPFRHPLLALLFLSGAAGAASVITDPLATDYTGPAGAISINTSDTNTVDLSDLTGLTPGQAIQIAFTPDNAMAWEGLFTYNDGTLEINWRAQVEISVGGETLLYTDLWTFGPAPALGGEGGVSGALPSPSPMTRWFVVPWGTDLSEVTITLRDLSTIDGSNGAGFTDSQMRLSGTLTTSTVPEPSTALMGALLPAAFLIRRRRYA